MSRRKQARPRSFKRSGGDDDEEEDMEGVLGETTKESTSDTGSVLMPADKTSPKESPGTQYEELVNGKSRDDTQFNCDTCGSVFDNLDHFMDHRNFECVPGIEGINNQWTIENLAVNMGQPDSPLSPRDSPEDDEEDTSLSVLDCPLSPDTEKLTPDQVPSAVGISDTNPYGCQFCDKAFSKLSHLKVHEQIHSDQLPFKCTFCSRLFRHKRSRDRHVKLHTGDKRFKCTQCDSAFARSDHLKSHLKTHENGKPYQCTTCNRGFQTSAALSSHLITHKKASDRTKEFRCFHCKESFASASELQSHAVVHLSERSFSDKSYQCTYCGEIFLGQDLLKWHIEQAHMSNHQKCPVCRETFVSTDELRHHMNIHETITNLDRKIQEEMDDRSSTSQRTTPISSRPVINDLLVCPYCFCSDFDSLEILEIHMQSVHSVKPTEVYTCNYCNAPYQNLYSLHEHMRAVHQNQPCLDIKYPCSHCSRQFSSIENLQQHKKLLHYYDRPERSSESLFCILCSISFHSPDALQEHMVMVHHPDSKHMDHKSLKRRPSVNKSPDLQSLKGGNDKLLKRNLLMSRSFSPKKERTDPPVSTYPETITCDQCNATFHDLKNFQSHMKHHLDIGSVGQYLCKVCKQGFNSEELLEKHSSSHYLSMTTEYGCTSCVKLFSKPDELQKHLMDIHAHHLYRCSLCKEIFDSKVNIQVHFAIKHSNECKLYKCTKCESVFRSEMEWQVHVRVNHLHVAKPYRCLFCKESFISEMDLQCHLTTHNKPFRCPMCEDSFHVEYLLDKHMQNVHGNVSEKQQQPPQMSPVQIKIERDVDSLGYNERTQPLSSPRFSPKNLNGPGIWKSSELLHTCNICDMKFEQQTLLLAHKAVDHGLSAKKSSSASNIENKVKKMEESPTQKKSPLQEQLQRDTNQTLTLEASAVSSHAPSSSTSSTSSMTLPVSMVSDKLNLACMYCSQTFKSRGDMDKHMKIHQNNCNLKCNICDQVFPTSSILAEHKLTHCKIVQGNNCVLCKLPLKSEDQFYVHTQEHGFQGTFMQCLICRQTLASMVELQMHGKHHFQVKSSFYTCCVCLKTFDAKENLVSKLNSSGRTYYVCKPCYHGEHSEYVCSECGVSFPTNSDLDSHMGIHKKTYQCIKCQESFSSEYEIQLHVATHVMKEGNVHVCKLCSRNFESPAKLQCHLIDHTYSNSEFRCSVCCKIFSSSSEIQNHAIEHGPEARRYACNQCPQKFFFSAELENHIFSHNDDARGNGSHTELSCNECHKTFNSIINLSNHRKIHAKREQKLPCALCPEVFEDALSLKHHFLTEHSSTDKRTFQCQECELTFPNLSILQGHMHIHETADSKCSRFPCPVCKKVFSLARNLTVHMRSHSGEKPYECPICKKRFARKENMKAHLRSHGSLKSFLCPICGKSFTRKHHVKEHMHFHFSQENNQHTELLHDMDIDSDNSSETTEESINELSPLGTEDSIVVEPLTEENGMEASQISNGMKNEDNVTSAL